MSALIRPGTIEDQPRIIELLTRVFQLGLNDTCADPTLFHWKYWEPRGDWPEPRALVMEKAGRIVGYAGLWPLVVRTGEKTERGVHMIDWAADAQSPGAGVSLLQRLTKSYDFVLGIGGSELTEAVFPKFGLRIVAKAVTLARPLRPLRQMLKHQYRDARLPARFLRNAWWSRMPAAPAARGWTLAEATPRDWKNHHFFEYLDRCPVAGLKSFQLLHGGRKTGMIALTVCDEQTRIAGISLDDPTVENWKMAFYLAMRAALRFTSTSEISARISGDGPVAGALQAGMRIRGKLPVFLFRKDDRALPLDFQLWDDDGLFRAARRPDFPHLKRAPLPIVRAGPNYFQEGRKRRCLLEFFEVHVEPELFSN